MKQLLPNWASVLALVVCALCPISQVAAAQTSALDDIEVTAAGNASRQTISFTLKNRGDRAVRVVDDYLPWKTASVLTLVAIPVSPEGDPVQSVHPVVDPRPAVLEIAAKAEFRGDLNVAPFFPRWDEMTKRGGVLLVWSFSLYDVATGHDRRFSGVIDYAPMR